MELSSQYQTHEKIILTSTGKVYQAEQWLKHNKTVFNIVREGAFSLEGSPLDNDQQVKDNFPLDVSGLVEWKRFSKIPANSFVEGISFDTYLKGYKYEVRNCLKISVKLAEILQHLHEKGIVHHDIRPANFCIVISKLDIILFDFSYASYPFSPSIQKNLENQKQFYSYTSPEQTGRISNEVDIRSDLYSLGIIMYELLAGSLPFTAEDSLALIHSHIAKIPESPSHLNPAIPEILSEIVLKLLAKDPTDRYQSPYGLKRDLEFCYEQLESTGKLGDFVLGQHDFSNKLQNATRFYGRKHEINILLHTFDEIVSGKQRSVFVGGYSGIGKSALVQKFRTSIKSPEVIFVQGKFHQFQKNLPYFAFRQILRELTDYMLTKDSEIISHWKRTIMNFLGSNGKLLTDLEPHLELLIGKQPAVPELEPNEAQNRFQYVFTNFINAITQNYPPVILFFDDLQWADSASIALLKIIINNQKFNHLLFIGAYRDNELDLTSAFSELASNFEREDGSIKKITLAPLPVEDIARIIHEYLKGNLDDDQAFLDLIYSKSHGNPFFIDAFLKSLYTEKMLTFDFKKVSWVWDISRISERTFGQEIVELLTGRIQLLPVSTQELLKIAACLGYRFDLFLMSVLLEKDAVQITETLSHAIEGGFVIVSAGDVYSFAHDKIHQSAYFLVPEHERSNVHLKIGNSLLEHLDHNLQQQYIFELVSQFNAGIQAIDNPAKRIAVSRLNCRAGIAAKASAAYSSSFEYFHIGIATVNTNLWKDDYSLALQLYTEGAESAFFSGNYDVMQTWLLSIMANAKNTIDKIKAYEIKIKWHTSQHELVYAVETALEVLALLHVTFPRNPGKLHVLIALLKIKGVMGGRSLDSLLSLPKITDPYAEAAIRILVSVGSAAYFARPGLLPLFATRAFYLMIKYGNSPYSGVLCVSYALIIIAGLGNLKLGSKLGELAIKLSEKFEISSLKCQTRMMYNSYIIHLKAHLKKSLEPLYNNYWYGLENGNKEFAAYSAYIYSYTSFFCARPLQLVIEENEKFCARLSAEHQSAYNMQKIFTEAVRILTDSASNDVTLLQRKLHEQETLSSNQDDETAICISFFYKQILSYLFGRSREALQFGEETKKRLNSLAGSSQIMLFYFFDTLIRISVLSEYSAKRNTRLYWQIKSNIRFFKKFVDVAPMNSKHRLILINAELNSLLGNSQRADRDYESAIDLATNNEYINDAALASELAGKHYQNSNRKTTAGSYLRSAHRLYGQWGALAKVNDIEIKYPSIFENEQRGYEHYSEVKLSEPASQPLPQHSKDLDLYSIMKAAMAISSEIQLEKLLKKLIRIATENAGAQKGYLILKNDDEFFVEVEGEIDSQEDVIVHSLNIKDNSLVSEAIVRLSCATKENIVIGNAAIHPQFYRDPVIQKKKSKSILCTPIIHQNHVFGLLYFENDLINDAFIQERIEVIKLLSGHISISLQNALNEEKKISALVEREKLLKKINQHQEELLEARLEIQEQTHHNISEELHDNIGQVLTVIKMNINTIDITSTNAANRKLSESRDLLTKVIQDLRNLTKTLNKDFIEKVGIVGAIEQLLESVRRTELYSVQFNVDGEIKRFESHRELLLFRIVQELLNNILKHAQASTIEINMKYEQEGLAMEVYDNGTGFEPSLQPLDKGLGLQTMKNRIKLINGEINFERQNPTGTLVTLRLRT